MSELTAFWREAVQRQPAVVLWLLVFFINAGMNAQLGFEIGGGQGAGAWLYGSAFLGLAGLGAWAASQYATADRGARGLLALLIGMQLVLGQMAGWQSMGLTLSRGAATLEGKAESRTTTHEALRAARAERAALGVVETVAAIEADARLECSRTSRTYRDGVGPACTALRVKLERAKRAGELDGIIARQTAALVGGSKIKDPNALYDVPLAMASGVAATWAYVTGAEASRAVTPEDIRFGWLVFLVCVLEVVATLGPRLFGLGPAAPVAGPHGGTPGNGTHGPGTHGAGTLGQPPEPVRLGWPRDEATGHAAGQAGATMRAAVDAVMGGALALPAPPPMAALAGPGGAGHYALHGAPISIHFAAPSHAPPWDGAAKPGSAVSEAPRAPDPLPGRSYPRRDLPALPADAPPVDRSRIQRALAPAERAAADVVLAFRAACVVDTPGALVAADDLHRRYLAWAGDRAIAEAPFQALLRDVAGLEPVTIAGAGHYRDVALRLGSHLEAVA
jgi:hypothetical protein